MILYSSANAYDMLLFPAYCQTSQNKTSSNLNKKQKLNIIYHLKHNV